MERPDLSYVVNEFQASVAVKQRILGDTPFLQQITDIGHLLIDRYALSPGAAYLLRPDQYVTARWKRATRSQVSKALEHSMGGDLG